MLKTKKNQYVSTNVKGAEMKWKTTLLKFLKGYECANHFNCFKIMKKFLIVYLLYLTKLLIQKTIANHQWKSESVCVGRGGEWSIFSILKRVCVQPSLLFV